MSVLLTTSKGDIVIDLFTKRAPRASRNFLKLAKAKKLHNNLVYNVQKGTLLTSGDPTGSGRGGMSIDGLLFGEQARFFADEIEEELVHDRVGLVAMANVGPNTNASQFYITTGAPLRHLDGKHTIFGKVAEGMDVVREIDAAMVDRDGRPLQIIRIQRADVLDDPFDDPPGLDALARAASPVPEHSEWTRSRIGELESLAAGDDEQLEGEEAERALQRSAAESRAEVLEMLGDLPSADTRPPDNVLFVCKLNPVTRDEDLELIFSRFGKIVSCNVVRDRVTGDSLSYAFVEFDGPEAAEQAYFKMDNVLIDDRRIKVDFSQSVSRLRQGIRDKLKEKRQRAGDISSRIRTMDRGPSSGDGFELVGFGAGSEAPRDAKRPRHR